MTIPGTKLLRHSISIGKFISYFLVILFYKKLEIYDTFDPRDKDTVLNAKKKNRYLMILSHRISVINVHTLSSFVVFHCSLLWIYCIYLSHTSVRCVSSRQANSLLVRSLLGITTTRYPARGSPWDAQRGALVLLVLGVSSANDFLSVHFVLFLYRSYLRRMEKDLTDFIG